MTAGLYVHVPFCLTRCGYCDFNAHAGLLHLAGRYVEALVREADLAAPSWRGVRFASIFFGGGTPTTLGAAALAALIRDLRERFDVIPTAEVTVEANPDTVDRRALAALRDGGVTRLSLGVQSFDPDVLRALDRAHPPSSARGAYRAARDAGFDDVNLDLIFGAHGETLDSWTRTLDEAVALAPDHLSCYALTIERGTPLGRAVLGGEVPPPDADLQAEMFEHACATLRAAGYHHYEISNWARPGRECVHNLGYWKGRPYLGLGAGAHSGRDGARWWNVRPPNRYIDEVLTGRVPIGGREEPDEGARRLERLFLGLRHAGGVPAGWVPAAAAAEVVDRGLARSAGGRLALTERGMLLANEVVMTLSS